MQIRVAGPGDWPHIWPFLHEIVAAGDTFAYDRDLDHDTAREMWMVGPPGRTVVAVADDATVVGTANTYRNKAGGGAHVASASYMVDPAHAGQGVGRALVLDSLGWARAQSFRGMQFNAVVETNAAAVGLYRSLGFDVIGTVPEGFDHPEQGYVGLHVMYLPL